MDAKVDVQKELDEAIERECKRIKRSRSIRARDDERRRYRHPAEYTLPPQRREADVTQLCDCPYWGTEFSE